MSDTHPSHDVIHRTDSRRSVLLRVEKLDNVSVRLGLTTAAMALMDEVAVQHHRRYQD